MTYSNTLWLRFLTFLAEHDALDAYLHNVFCTNDPRRNPLPSFRRSDPIFWLSAAFTWSVDKSVDWSHLDELWTEVASVLRKNY